MIQQTFYLTDEEKEFFDENGYLGPYTLFSPEETKQLWKKLSKELLDTRHAAYPGAPYNYDRHLDISFLSNFITHPEIVQRVQGILGSSVSMWRSEFFSKHRGDPGTAWHQVEKFSVGEQGAQLVPTSDINGVWQLTCWLALTPSTIESGCMRFMPGTHKKWYFNEDTKLEFRPEDKDTSDFYGYNFNDSKLNPKWEPDNNNAVNLVMKPGQFVLFTSKLMHGSLPNTMTSGPGRISVTSRYISDHVNCYPNRDYFEEFGERFSLEKHGYVVVSGESKNKHNKIVNKNLCGEIFEKNPSLPVVEVI